MEQTKQNKEFIMGYLNAIASQPKTKTLLEKFISDEGLIQHILFFDGAFPGYEVLADEITAEGNRIIIKARMKGRHEGELNGIPPTHKKVEFPFAVGYEIENRKIVSHWLIADQMMLMEQLGVVGQPT